ncbi:GDSL-type esterase/lipase family protein [Butyrivibrio sp. MC2021]|uniref:GDSL-type esterase/lipase family protein n=1 Tax=Butyrivibrio sp. MC2021 TaxID=1408306 RepID=UPI00047DEE76|nr:GDSL-type esterase/lipase family protein [Butyrivibrio sp. MC2021]
MTIRRRLERMMQSLGKREMIIVSSAIIAVTIAIILVMAFIKVSKDSALGEGGMAAHGVSDDMIIDGAGENAAAGEEDIPKVETATAGMKTESTPDTTILAKKEGAKDGYLNRCVFLGDSRTVSMVNYGFFNDDAALAQIGISHPSFASNTFINNAGKEYTLKSYLGSHQAPVIYMLLGVNGINDPSESHYQNTFISLIDSVIEMAPNSNIVLVAIGPVDDNGIYKNTVQNALIDKYNDFLLKTAKEKHIFYLNIAEILKGSDGQVKYEYNGGDGLHYSGKGCEAIFRYIVEHPVPGISDDGEYVVKYIKPDPNKIKVSMGNESGIDKDKLKDLMDIMTGSGEGQSASTSSTESSSAAASEASSLDEEEAKKKAEEEEKKKKEEEEKKKAEEEKKKKEEEEKKKAEEEEKKKKEEEEKKKAEEEERKKKEEEEKKKAEEEERKKKEEEEKKKEEEEKKKEEEENKEEESEEEEGGESEEGENESGNENSTDQADGGSSAD